MILHVTDALGKELTLKLLTHVADDFGNIIELQHGDGQTENIRRINRSHDIAHLLEQERF